MEKKMNGQPALNGQPSMEEILASIRKIIAEEPIGASPPFPEPRLITGTNARADSVAEDASEFDLPNILRPSAQPSPEKHTPLFGRLADALRGATSNNNANNNAANGNAASNETKNARSPADETASQSKDSALPAGPIAAPIEIKEPTLSLSSLTPVRSEPVAPAPTPAPTLTVVAPVVAPAEEPKQADEPSIAAPALRSGAMSAPRGFMDAGSATSRTADGVKRVMVPFKDQRMSRMSGMSSFEPEAPAPASANDAFPDAGDSFGVHAEPAPIADPETAAASANALGALAMGLAGSGPSPFPSDPFPQSPQTSSFAPDMPPVMPPAIPAATTPVDAAGAAVKDTAAELLRPMLRQWLADNMPRIVEQALHIEVAESLKPGKK